MHDIKRNTFRHTPSDIQWERGDDIVKPDIPASGFHPWPLDPTFPLHLRFVALGLRPEIPLLRHDYFEICFLHKGAGIKQVQDRFLPMRAGDLFIMGDKFYHRIAEYSETVEEILLYFLPELICSGDCNWENTAYLTPFVSQDSTFPRIIPSATGIPSQVFDLLMKIQSEQPLESDHSRLAAKTYLKMILVLLGKYYRSCPDANLALHQKRADVDRLKPLFDYMNSRYSERITVDDAAQILDMSRSHFMRFFQKTTGESFVKYLNRFRIAKAGVLLASTDKSISEVAQEVGFCDQSYFSQVFQKIANLTPRQYKAQAASGNESQKVEVVRERLPVQKTARMA